ncbi:MAG: RHS repeat protein [Chloroflexi bacterium]|nr:RHS repeat protein [Chloroflexota bacterium]
MRPAMRLSFVIGLAGACAALLYVTFALAPTVRAQTVATATATRVVTPTATLALAATATSAPVTSTATATPLPAATNTATPLPATNTPAATSTATAIPPITATATSTPLPTATATATTAPTATSTATPVVTPTVVFTPTATPTLTPTVILTATLSVTPTAIPTATVEVTTTIMVSAAIGGQLHTTDGVLTLDLPSSATATDLVIQHIERAPIYTRSLVYVFDLTARQVSNGIGVDAFAKPLTLTINYSSFWNRLSGGTPALFTFSTQAQRWERVDAVNNYESRTLTAAISHFSQWGLGQFTGLDQHYLPSMNSFGEDPFMGSATVNYPIALPVLPGNVMPPLALAYSSASAAEARRDDDTLMYGRQSSFLGAAWSLNGLPTINRQVTVATRWFSEQVPYDRYYVSAPGASGRIVQWPAASGGDDYWHPLNEGYARLSRLNGESQWLMFDPNGTQYRFDKFGEYRYPGFLVTGYASYCDAPSSFPNQWNVTAITDTHQNVATIDYRVQTRQINYLCDDVPGERKRSYTSINAIYPMTITVNGMRVATFVYETKPDKDMGYCGSDNDPNYGQDAWSQKTCAYDRLATIQVWANGNIVRSYVLGYDTAANKTRVTGISLRGQGGAISVPTYTLGYGTSGDDSQFVVTGTNGYGGGVEYHYGQETIASWCVDPATCNTNGQSKYWAVMTKTVSSVTPSASFLTTWAYGALTLQTNALGFNPQVNYTPTEYDAIGVPEETGDKLLGHGVVTQTVYAGGTTASGVASRSVQKFHQRLADNKVDPRQGRMYEARQLSPSGSVLVSTTAVYSYVVLQDRSSMPLYDRNFIRLDESDAYACEGTATCRQTRTTYGYDTYGNTVAEWHYGDVNDAADDFTIHRKTYPYSTTTGYIVNKIAWENTFVTIMPTNVGSINLKTQAIYYFDGQGLTTPPIKGDVTRIVRGNNPANDPNGFYVTTTLAFDSYGNPTVVTDTRGYTATTGYDSVYHVLPLTVTNALGQRTVTQYDLTLQKPLTVTDPNGAVTSIAYDAFGRRTSVWSPTEQGGAATAKMTYSDTIPFVFKVEVRTDAPGEATTYQSTASIYNGLGQVVQSQSASDTAGQIIVSNQRYNALGKVEAASVPTSVVGTLGTFVSGEWSAIDSRPRTTTSFDALARPVWVVNPDGTTGGAAYGALAQTNIDANRHVKLSFQDALGRLSAVDETLVRWSDGFDNASLPGWSLWNNQVTASGSTLNEVGNGVDYNANAVRVATTHDSQGVVFDFELDAGSTPDSEIFLETGDWPAGSWRSWGLRISGGVIARQAYGVADASLLALKTGVWYRALLKAGGTGEFITQVWERDNPASGAELREVKSGDGNWVGRTWNFMARVKVGTQRLDNYDELQFNTTRYGYDMLGHLTRVTDTVGNTTVITYDNLGRKTGMLDPDMGRWLYAYDAAGNLTSQTDAKGQTLSFTYDQLNRLTRKTYPVGSSLAPITYTYDTGTNGVGNRVRMDDATGYTTWAYDARGRATREVKSITSVGVFTTSTSYDAADRVRSLTYPTGEVITNAYSTRGLLDNVRSQSNGQWLASNLDYNVNGSLARLDLGNGLSTLFGYFGIGSNAWGANSWDSPPSTGLSNYGRLWRIRTESPSGAAVQDLRYAYDSVGNVTAIRDVPRAITGTLNITFSDPFDSAGGNWSTAGNVTIPYNDAGNNTARLVGNGTDYSVMLTRTGYTLASGTGMEVRFKLDNALNSFSLGINSNNAAYQRLAVVGEATGHLAMQYYDGVGKRYPVWLTPTLQANTWYTLTMVVDDARGLTLEVYTATAGVHYAYNLDIAGGQQWHFLSSIKSGTLYLDDYREFNGGALVVPDDKQAFQYDALDRLTQVISTTTQGYSGTYAYNAIGNLTGKDEGSGSVAYSYPSAGQARPHAATAMGSNAYTYDLNGNMTLRAEAGTTYTQTWDVDNRLVLVTTSNGASMAYIYDGDGKRVKWVANGVTTTVAVGALYERNVTAGTDTSYYFAGGKRVAVRNAAGLYFIQGDHLGSNSLTTDANGAVVASTKYYAYGGTRTTSGAQQTDRLFTDQRAEGAALGALYDYGARHYDTLLGRFLSADSIVPGAGNPQALNRYSYTYNNPLKYTDPTGHCPACAFGIVLLGAYVGGRGAWELSTVIVPGADRASRDQVGGQLVTQMSQAIESESASRGLDPTLVKAILRHESAAFERRLLTPIPNQVPGAIANGAESLEVLVPGHIASIGPGQMQLRRARQLEGLGYVRTRANDQERVAALQNSPTAIEYVSGMAQYLTDQLSAMPGFDKLGPSEKQRLILIGYNWGWDGDRGLQANIEKHGFQWVIDSSDYDQQTLDEYLRWSSQQ